MPAKPFAAALLACALLFPASATFAEARDPGPMVQVSTAKVKMSRKERRALAAAEAAAEADRAALKEVVAEVASAPKKGRIWCVPFARAVSGIEIKGNAATWWKQAADLYARGNEPKVGAVLNFRASRAMPMGHVAVVSAVVSDREVLVDQANWERNRITEDTLVVDVSAKNDWSEVRVANANGTLGRTNPVYGFIYR
ncbi:CHAP domain-containing protein [Tabrizicola fusiformis]|uniref:CHAP domain-containing protein n=1 Tax=Tabrizicola sp. SY72 TaxID=2741673 RepID=UPI001F5101E9|nr:CHAP domain-containing protein [Tabrizicola sp. SY72]